MMQLFKRVNLQFENYKKNDSEKAFLPWFYDEPSEEHIKQAMHFMERLTEEFFEKRAQPFFNDIIKQLNSDQKKHLNESQTATFYYRLKEIREKTKGLKERWQTEPSLSKEARFHMLIDLQQKLEAEYLKLVDVLKELAKATNSTDEKLNSQTLANVPFARDPKQQSAKKLYENIFEKRESLEDYLKIFASNNEKAKQEKLNELFENFSKIFDIFIGQEGSLDREPILRGHLRRLVTKELANFKKGETPVSQTRSDTSGTFVPEGPWERGAPESKQEDAEDARVAFLTKEIVFLKVQEVSLKAHFEKQIVAKDEKLSQQNAEIQKLELQVAELTKQLEVVKVNQDSAESKEQKHSHTFLKPA